MLLVVRRTGLVVATGLRFRSNRRLFQDGVDKQERAVVLEEKVVCCCFSCFLLIYFRTFLSFKIYLSIQLTTVVRSVEYATRGV